MLKCVLLDANIVIESHKVGVWEKLVDKVEIVVSSIVAHKESMNYGYIIRRDRKCIHFCKYGSAIHA